MLSFAYRTHQFSDSDGVSHHEAQIRYLPTGISCFRVFTARADTFTYTYSGAP